MQGFVSNLNATKEMAKFSPFENVSKNMQFPRKYSQNDENKNMLRTFRLKTQKIKNIPKLSTRHPNFSTLKKIRVNHY